MIFFLALTVRGPFNRKDLSEKNMGYRLISEKTEALYAGLNQRVDAATSSYSVAGDFLQHIYTLPVPKNHQNI